MIEERKAALRAEIARCERELVKLEALPGFEELVDGSVVALNVTLGRSRPYVFIAYKTRGRWYLTGERSPNGATSDELAEWLVTSGRRLESAAVLAEIETETETVGVAVDLGALLGPIREYAPRVRGFCQLPDCYCNGNEH